MIVIVICDCEAISYQKACTTYIHTDAISNSSIGFLCERVDARDDVALAVIVGLQDLVCRTLGEVLLQHKHVLCLLGREREVAPERRFAPDHRPGRFCYLFRSSSSSSQRRLRPVWLTARANRLDGGLHGIQPTVSTG